MLSDEREKKFALVVTTIFEPAFLESYIQDIERGGFKNAVQIFVIPDKKTPESVFSKCHRFHEKGFAISCPTLSEQEDFLGEFPSLAGRIPYNSDNRRNIGFLMALQGGAEVLISIDDDNYCLPKSDFVKAHACIGALAQDAVVESSDGWFNLCSLLEGSTEQEIFPRGFPYFARRQGRQLKMQDPIGRRVAMNAGLWISDPDVDAISRLALAPAPVVHNVQERSVILGGKTWSPINTQNTAVSREVIAAFYYVRMGFPVGGMSIDRFGDILSGYFAQKCVKSRGEMIRLGTPITDHRRTPHNLFKDLYNELAGIVLLEELLPWLIELRLDGSSYAELYAHLAEALESQSAKFKGFIWDDGGREFLVSTAANMRAWLDAVKVIQ